MSAAINTGGPAFPTENERQTGSNSWHFPGMTLRDYFAAKAMQGLQANPTDEVMKMGFDAIAQYAYKQADAMLKAREA